MQHTTLTHPSPPTPRDPSDLQRWEHTRLRRRMLYGQWAPDLTTRVRKAVGAERAGAWGEVDLSSNVFRAINSQLAVLYAQPPTVTHAAAEAAAPLVSPGGLLARSGLWSLMTRVQRDTLGLRDMHVRVEVSGGRPVYRPVYPDLVVATPHPDRPGEPITIREARPRFLPDSGRAIWTWDVLDISDPDAPVYKVLDARHETGGADLTQTFLGRTLSGTAYPYRDASDRPVIPYATYHAAETGCLYDPYEQRELVEGSLQVAVYWTFFSHCVKNASWPQRYSLNADVEGAGVEGEEARQTVITDPAVLLKFRELEDSAGQPIIGQFDPGADPAVLQTAIAAYERRVAGYAGLDPSDIQRVSGDPRSGYALAVSREGRREAQRQFEPMFRRADLELIRLSAILLNREHEIGLPEEGYSIRYEALPKSAGERAAERDQLEWEMGQGFISPIEAYQRIKPGISKEAAEREIVQARAERARLAALSRAAAPEPPQSTDT